MLLLVSVFISHPLVLCLNLVGSSLLLGVVLHRLTSLWILNALILIFLGGMIVLFLYISTLSNNEKLLIPTESWLVLIVITVVIIVLITSGLTLSFLGGSGGVFHNTCEQSIRNLSTLYTLIRVPHLRYMLTMLLVTLFCTVKITEGFKGSLTKKTQNDQTS